jgi:esterase/lipase
MENELIHVYFMPGMAASSKIFEHIKLPAAQFQMHYLEWKIPTIKESLSSYAQRMITDVHHENVVLIGVSFGGIIVQEMSKHMKLRKLIIISTVKTKHELPKKMRFVKATKAYQLIPGKLVSNLDIMVKYAFGESISKRMELYQKYLAVTNKHYIKWAIKQMVCWEQSDVISGVIHIHGDKDPVFPIANINNCVVVEKGTHIMIINKYKWFNEHLPKLILIGIDA